MYRNGMLHTNCMDQANNQKNALGVCVPTIKDSNTAWMTCSEHSDCFADRVCGQRVFSGISNARDTGLRSVCIVGKRSNTCAFRDANYLADCLKNPASQRHCSFMKGRTPVYNDTFQNTANCCFKDMCSHGAYCDEGDRERCK